ncbi:MAG: MgtC/SapB family protein [Gemmatimonadota bacterium]|jgi:putative Mg2+ transporter-C (MgtC) family protein
MESLIASLPSWLQALEPEVLGRLLLATVLGGSIGFERELSGKPAGLRTNILICVGATLFTEASLRVAAEFATNDWIRADPGRIAYGIVTGIGFIGAGTILVLRGTVIGLTSAATLWVVAAIGLTVGLRDYATAIGGTVLVLLTLAVLARIERRFSAKFSEVTLQKLRVAFDPGSDAADAVERLLRERGLDVVLAGFDREHGSASVSWGLRCALAERHELIERLSELPGIRSVRVD